MASTEKVCTQCGRSKALDEYHKTKVTPDGHTAACKTCRNSKKGAKKLTDNQLAVLRMLRQNGLKHSQLKDRAGDNVWSVIKSLLDQGHVRNDGHGYYELTESGKAAAPCRNPAYAKRFLSAGAIQAQQKAH